MTHAKMGCFSEWGGGVLSDLNDSKKGPKWADFTHCLQNGGPFGPISPPLDTVLINNNDDGQHYNIVIKEINHEGFLNCD